MTSPPPPDVAMASPSLTEEKDQEPKYGGFTRFEIELEFVQCLANPQYLLHLATLTSSQSPTTPFNPTSTAPSTSTSTTNPSNVTSTPLLQSPNFIAYLSYLRYFSEPPYIKFLTYPGPTLKNLELLQSERFRREILSPEVVARLAMEGIESTVGS